jgi:hypothetical protein
MSGSLVRPRDRTVPNRYTGDELEQLKRALYSRAPRNAVQLARLRERLGGSDNSHRVDSSLLRAVNA